MRRKTLRVRASFCVKESETVFGAFQFLNLALVTSSLSEIVIYYNMLQL